MKKTLITISIVVLALMTSASAQSWLGVVASSRAIDWTGAGVVGGIPTTWSRCTTGTGTSILASSSTAAQINTAISGCDSNHYVELGAGTFNLNNGLLWNAKNSVALRGQGASSTLLVFTGSQSCSGSPTASICFMSTDGNYFGSPSNTANWTAGYSVGATSITLSSVTNLAVGNPITLDQTDDVCGTITGGVCAGDNSAIFICYTPLSQCSSNGDNGGGPRTGRSQQQIVTVTGIAGNVITISPGLRMPNWSSGKSPQAWWATSPVKNVGIENVSIDSTSAGSNESITFFNCLNCWAKGVRSIGPTGRSHVVAWQSAHITIQDSYFYKTNDTASVNYGIESLPASDMLVQNNIFEQIQAPYPANGSCTGCVFAYNFDVNNVFCCTTQFQNQSGFAHSVGDDFMLYEGNIGSGFASDNFHGTHHLITNFRNYWNGYQKNEGVLTTQATTPLIIKSYSRFYNAIGNVLGNPAKHTTYSTLYDIGLGNGIPNDSQTGITLMRWGNFANCSGASPCQTNIFNNAEVPSGLSGAQATFANSVPASQALPASFYLSVQPAWWPAGKTWPPIGPDVTGGNVKYCVGGTWSGTYVLTSGQCPSGTATTLAGGRVVSNPAMDCYLNTMSGPPDGQGAVLAFNPSACYVVSGLPAVSFSPASLNFPLQLIGTQSAPSTTTLTNTGTATLAISSLRTFTEFVKTSSTCGVTLNAGASCTTGVAFAPTGGGPRSGILQLTDNASGSPHTVALSGPGLVPGIVINGGTVEITGNVSISVASGSPAAMGIVPSSLNFGAAPVGSVNTLVLTVTNTGVGALIFSSITLADTSNYSETDNCTSLLATQTCTINVTFSPDVVAALNTTLTIVANDSGSPHAVTILGSGIAVGGDLPFPNFALQGGVAFLMPQVGVDPMVYSTQNVQQSVYIGNSTCPTAPARTNYLGVSKGSTVCDFADSNGTGLQTVVNDWASGTYGDQRWDGIVTHGSSFNFGGTAWTWKDKYSGVPTVNFLVFHSDTPNPRGRTVCSHGIQDVLTPPLPDAGQRNHGCQGYLGFPAVSVPIPVTNSAYTFDSTFNDLANMWTITSTATGTGSVIKMGPASTAGDPFGDCSGPCPTDGVNHIIMQDAKILPASSVTISIVPVGIMAAEWIGTSGLSAHYLPAAPHDIGFDENYFTADADDDGFGTNAINNHIQFACAKCWFNHNYADAVKRDGAEDHVLNLSNAPGPVQVSHNWLEGGSSGLWGGGGSLPSVVGLLTTNVERRRNRLTYNQRWLPPPAGLQPFSKGVSGGSCSGGNTLVLNIPNTGSNIIANLVVYLKTITGVGTITNQWYTATSINSTAVTLTTTCTNGTVSAAGSVYGFASNAVVTSAAAMNGKATSDPKFANPVAKNRSENKEGQSTIEDGEILENCGADGQSGFCLLVSVRACGGVSWCAGGQSYMISDWASTNNIFRHGNQAFQISARSGGSNNRSWPVTAITCAADGNSAAITATGLNAGLSAPNTDQTVYGTDVYLASIGNGVSSGLPLLANGFYATAYPTNGNYALDSVVTVKGTAICPANDTTAAGSVYGPDSNNGAGVTLPGRRYVFQNNLIYDMGDHSQWNGGGSVTFVQNGAGNNNYTVNMTVTQVSPVVIVNAAVQAINACPVSQLCPKVLQAAVGDYAYIQCLADNRFSTGGPKTKGVPILSVAGDQLSFTYTPQNGSPALTLSDTTSCPLAALNSSTESGYYNGQSFPWPSYWNHNTGVGVNLFVNGTGGGGFIKYSTYQNSFHLIPGTGDVAPANAGANGGGFRCNNSDVYSGTDATGITFCNDRPTFTYQRYVMATRAIANNPNFLAGTTCAPSCSQDPAINPNTNSTPARVSTPGASVTCGGVACDSSHFVPDSVGISGSMGTSNYPLNLADWRTYSLHSSSPYKAGGLLQATDGKDLGVQMSLIINAQNRTLYPCPLSCGTGLFRDGPQYGWLTWSASSDPGLINYRVYRDGSGTPTATVTSTFYTDYGLAAGAHTWIVKAWNGTIETTVSGLTSQVF